jgi:transcriptional regulator with GAF, ATPase, and Fis domain
LESELFGYKKGAFTGATEDKTGLLGNAEGGTVFLDEIGDMSLQLQARVLRVIQNNEIKPLGESRTKKINVRFICATNKDLKEAIEKRQFREDLFYRINVLPLHMPPLRERKKDIPLLLKFFLKREADILGIPVKRISPKVLHSLVEYPWGGNIRELENFVKYILSTVDGVSIGRADIPNHLTEKGFEKKEKTNRLHFPENVSASHQISSQSTPQDPFAGYGWKELEHAYVIYLLEKNKWNVTRAAQDAKVNRSTFDSRMKKLGISKK